MSDTITDTDTDLVLKLPSSWVVLLHNDDFTPMDFVTAVLMQIFNKPEPEAVKLMWLVHQSGKAAAGLYTKEIALTKVAMVQEAAQRFEHPLLATAEPA